MPIRPRHPRRTIASRILRLSRLGVMAAASLAALAYLIVFGSIVGYTAYMYALRHASPTIVGTYAYVNPVVAVLLGWLILHESVTVRTFAAMGLILGAVLMIQLAPQPGRHAEPSRGPAREEARA